MNQDLYKIIVVGGGAGGLELATKLGDTLGKKKKAHITLVDAKRPTFGNLYCMKLLQAVLILIKMNLIILPKLIGIIFILG